MRKAKSEGAAVLHLNLHREHFASVAAGTKRIEYRKQTAYWQTRLHGRHYDVVHFRNGYHKVAPEIHVQWKGVRKIRQCGEPYYAIHLGRILRISNWKGRDVAPNRRVRGR
jgi:hypothetical protein